MDLDTWIRSEAKERYPAITSKDAGNMSLYYDHLEDVIDKLVNEINDIIDDLPEDPIGFADYDELHYNVYIHFDETNASWMFTALCDSDDISYSKKVSLNSLIDHQPSTAISYANISGDDDFTEFFVDEFSRQS